MVFLLVFLVALRLSVDLYFCMVSRIGGEMEFKLLSILWKMSSALNTTGLTGHYSRVFRKSSRDVAQDVVDEDFQWHDITWNSSMVKNLCDILHRLRQRVLAFVAITIGACLHSIMNIINIGCSRFLGAFVRGRLVCWLRSQWMQCLGLVVPCYRRRCGLCLTSVLVWIWSCQWIGCMLLLS